MAKYVLILALVVAAVAATSPEQQKWLEFKQNHQKLYKSYREELKRFEIFKDNLKEIQEHNELYEKGQTSYKKGVNQFADLTREEFKEYLKMSPRPKSTSLPKEKFVKPVGVEIPESKDWREEGAVGKVKNQGQCGSCWSFSTTGSLEGQEFLTTGQLTLLSEQELVDCSREAGNAGCAGGYMEGAFEYVEKNGIASEDDYPYTAEDGKCKRENLKSAFKISKYVEIISGDEEDLKAAVATVGPISVAVDASNYHLYDSGLFDDQECGNDEDSLNHGVLAVGYGTEGNDSFWIVKNSWGESWGEKGYVKTLRNVKNQCGIATDSSYPLV